MSRLAINDRIAFSGGYDGYPMWDRSREPLREKYERRWKGTIIAFIDVGRNETCAVVRMDEVLLDEFDTSVLWLRYVGATWNESTTTVNVCLTSEESGPEGWAKSLRDNYMEAAVTLERL